MAVPNFDPGQAIDPALEPTVIAQPISMPNQLGGVVAGVPTVADPAQAAAARYAAINRQAQFQLAANPPTAPLQPSPLGAPAPAIIDPAIAGGSPPAVAAPPGPAVAIPPPTSAPAVPDQMAGATNEVRAAGQESTQVGREGVEAAQQSAQDLAKADELRAQEAQASADRLTALQKRQETAFNESKTAFDDAKRDVANFKFHDFFANQSFARQALTGIGMLLGGASYDANHVNQAVNVVQSAIKRDGDQQLAYLTSKEHLAELAQQGVRDTQSYLAHEMSNFQMAESLKKEAVARQIDAFTSTTRGKQNIVAARQVAAGLREQAAKDAQAAILQGTHNRMMQSEIAKNYAAAAKERAGAGEAGAAKKQQQDLAFERQIASETTRFNKNVPKLIESRNKVTEGLDAIDSGNPTSTYAALEAFTRATTGLGARQVTMDNFQRHMGGTWSRFKNMVDNGATGGMDPGMVQNLRGALETQGRSLDTIAKTQAKLAGESLKRNPAFKGREGQIDSSVAQLFQLGGGNETPADPNAEARAWAAANPRDPRAAKILARLGAQ